MVTPPGQVFVTGGSGFVGRHIVRELNNQHYKVRSLVTRVPLQGFDPSVELVLGDLTKPETYVSSLSGVSAVVHAALTGDLSHDLQMTSTLQHLSEQAGVLKFVHLSSIAVYGGPSSGTVTEETPSVPSLDAYSRVKLAIEQELRAHSGIPEVIILRLGCVYGPGGGWWTKGLLNQMDRGKLILVNGGTGTANLIHVADVATTISILLARSNPPFEIYNLTDGMPVTWSRYFSELETLLGRTATVSMSVAEAREYGIKWLRASLLRRLGRKLFGARHIHPLDEQGITGFTSQAIYSNQKAVAALAFRPAYDLQSGMRTVGPKL